MKKERERDIAAQTEIELERKKKWSKGARRIDDGLN